LAKTKSGAKSTRKSEKFKNSEKVFSEQHQFDTPSASFRMANYLLRNGNLGKALEIYLQLHQQQSLQMYENNALYTAKKLGLGQFKSIKDLRENLSIQ
jgi:hypothetical protein